MDFIGPVFWLLVALGLLVTFHEFGHFWVARRCGVRVLCFSVGFGRPLWSRTGADGTQYQIAAIPLGGYVKMQDERVTPVAPDRCSESFNRKPVGQRIAIVAAGPIFNLIFALVAFWLMFIIGIGAMRPVIGDVDGLAAEAGVKTEDRILQVNEQAVDTWTHALLALMPIALDGQVAELQLESPGQSQRRVQLDLSRLPPGFDEEKTLEAIGLSPWRPSLPAEVGAMTEGGPASRSGLRAGDLIVELNGVSIDDWSELVTTIEQQALDANGLPQPMTVVALRDGERWVGQIQAELDDASGRAMIGIQSPTPSEALQEAVERAFVIERVGPLAALPKASSEMWRLTTATLGMLGRMITGRASLENLSGPITIAQLADQSARLGLSRFLFFLGLISLSLAIINLLPIPMLDGGHLMYYLVEILKGSPVSEQTQVVGQYVGLMLVVMLMGVALFNDILRLIT